MIIAVLNLSGNTCKTTNTQSFLLPRIPDCDVIRIETINNDGLSEGEKVTGKNQELLFLNDNIILDIGSSNISDFMDSVKKDKGSHDAIDYFIIPTVPDEKQITDTISTVGLLTDLGIDSSKIRLIFNKVDEANTNDNEFSKLNRVCRNIGLDINHVPRIEYSKLFELLSKTKQTMQDCLNDETDYKALLKEASIKAIAARKDGDLKVQEKARIVIAGLIAYQSTLNMAKCQSNLYDIEFNKLNLI